MQAALRGWDRRDLPPMTLYTLPMLIHVVSTSLAVTCGGIVSSKHLVDPGYLVDTCSSDKPVVESHRVVRNKPRSLIAVVHTECSIVSSCTRRYLLRMIPGPIVDLG